MSTVLPLVLDEQTRDQIEHLARVTGKPREVVIREVVKTGLKSYKQARPNTAKALQELADYAEKIGATGPKDLSTNHNTYAWDE